MNLEIKIIFDNEKKRTIMYKCDSAFDEPLCVSPKGDLLMEKICNKAFFISANIDDEIVGYCAVYANDHISKCAYITMLAVRGEFQRMGVGQALVDSAISVALQNQMKYLRLEVKDINTKAIKFYEKNEFIYTGERNDCGGSYMEKKLYNNFEG